MKLSKEHFKLNNLQLIEESERSKLTKTLGFHSDGPYYEYPQSPPHLLHNITHPFSSSGADSISQNS
jgi:hypothetical protein